MAAKTKRLNFNIIPEQETEIARFRKTLDAPSAKDTIPRGADRGDPTPGGRSG